MAMVTPVVTPVATPVATPMARPVVWSPTATTPRPARPLTNILFLDPAREGKLDRRWAAVDLYKKRKGSNKARYGPEVTAEIDRRKAEGGGGKVEVRPLACMQQAFRSCDLYGQLCAEVDSTEASHFRHLM